MSEKQTIQSTVPRNFLQGRKKDVSDRINQIRQDKSIEKDYSVLLLDIDTSVLRYVENVIQPKVKQNNELIKVPVILGSPERWKSAQKDGYFRDKAGTILLPLIMITRNGIAKNAAMVSDKLNGNVFLSFQKAWNDRTRYDNFSTQIGLKPSRKVVQVQVPDYVVVSYACKIWTDKVEQMNSLIELFVHAEGTYWGDPNRFKFFVKYDSLTGASELASTEDRKIITEFTIELHGYILKEAFNNATSTITLGFNTTPKRFITTETVVTAEQMNEII
jgi:hypothetical protein